jgi:hypothetical protein
MVIFDGPGDTYEFMLSDGVNTHYYDIYAIDADTAFRVGTKWFNESYNTVPTEVKFGCTGLPLTKNY